MANPVQLHPQPAGAVEQRRSRILVQCPPLCPAVAIVSAGAQSPAVSFPAAVVPEVSVSAQNHHGCQRAGVDRVFGHRWPGETSPGIRRLL